MTAPNFEPRPMGGADVNGRTWVRIWDAQKWQPFSEGKVIAYSDRPTIVNELPDGTHQSWVASLPWERIDPPAAVADAVLGVPASPKEQTDA